MVQSGGDGVGNCVVVVEQQAVVAVVLTPCAPSLEDLGQATVHAPLGIDCLPLLERGRDRMTGFSGEDCDYLFGSVSRSLEFHGWALIRKKSPLQKPPPIALFLDLTTVLCVYGDDSSLRKSVASPQHGDFDSRLKSYD